MTTTLTGRNQITVPAQLVHQLGLKAGMRIEWLVGDSPDEFRCRVLPDPEKLAHELSGAGRRYLRSGAEHPVAALLAEREAEDAAREKAL